jgi:hypothetical protein
MWEGAPGRRECVASARRNALTSRLSNAGHMARLLVLALVTVVAVDASASRRHLAQTTGYIRGMPISKWGEGAFPRIPAGGVAGPATEAAEATDAAAAAVAVAVPETQDAALVPQIPVAVPMMPQVSAPWSVFLLSLDNTHAPQGKGLRRVNIASPNSTYDECAGARRAVSLSQASAPHTPPSPRLRVNATCHDCMCAVFQPFLTATAFWASYVSRHRRQQRPSSTSTCT